jgi:hypothetical protein
MNNELELFVKSYYDIVDAFYDNQRRFLASIKESGIDWWKCESHNKEINNYYYQIRRFISESKIDWIRLLWSNDSELRRVTLMLIIDGVCDFSNNKIVLEKLIKVSVEGNDVEKVLARDTLSSRGWLSEHGQLVKNVFDRYYLEKEDYFLYKDMGDFLEKIGFNDLLRLHVEKGLQAKDEEIVELAHEYAQDSVYRLG